jgi:hypothetical protein
MNKAEMGNLGIGGTHLLCFQFFFFFFLLNFLTSCENRVTEAYGKYHKVNKVLVFKS